MEITVHIDNRVQRVLRDDVACTGVWYKEHCCLIPRVLLSGKRVPVFGTSCTFADNFDCILKRVINRNILQITNKISVSFQLSEESETTQ